GAPVARGMAEKLAKRPEPRTFRLAQRLGRGRRLAKVAHGRERRADVEDAVLPHRDDRRAVDLGAPDTRRQRPRIRVCGQRRLLAQLGHRHWRSLGTAFGGLTGPRWLTRSNMLAINRRSVSPRM